MYSLLGLGRYFDNAATTPLDERVLQEMIPFLQDGFGNANSIHSYGQRSRAAVEIARQRVASLIGAEDTSQIIFTSGATESNNQVLRSFSNIAVSPFEHSAVREPARVLGAEILRCEGTAVLPPENPVELISLMKVNNETGTVWDPQDLKRHAAYIHSDMTQAVGKIPIDLEHIAFASFSAHKFYGPKGVGGLYFADTPPKALLVGGEQENHLRGGTLNVPGIVGMGVAAELAQQEMESSLTLVTEMRSAVLEGLIHCSDWMENGGDRLSPYILSLSFLGVEGETLVIEADRYGFAISSGAACSSNSIEPSHVLRALKTDEQWARGTIRISFGKFSTVQVAADLSRALRHAVDNLRRMNNV